MHNENRTILTEHDRRMKGLFEVLILMTADLNGRWITFGLFMSRPF